MGARTGADIALPVNWWNNGEFKDQYDPATDHFTTLGEMFARDMAVAKTREYVSSDGSLVLPAYRNFLQKFNPAFLYARDFKLHEDYGTFMYPETYIIDSKGKVLHKLAEPVDWMDPRMTQLIDSLL